MPFVPIQSIDELVKELLRHREPMSYGRILARYAEPTPDLVPYLRWNSKHYTRTCINRNDDFELLVICYEPGQSTSIHDYDSQTAWIHPIVGELVEERYALTGTGGVQLTEEKRLRPGIDDVLTSGMAIHRFINFGPGRAITLNLYARPMSKWRVYDERTGSSDLRIAGPR